MASGRVDVRPLISRRISLERVVADGFEATGGSDIKVLVSTRPAEGMDPAGREASAGREGR